MSSTSPKPFPSFGPSIGTQVIVLNHDDTNPPPDSTPCYRASRALPASPIIPALAAIYRLTVTLPGEVIPSVYIGKTTSMKRRTADYLEMVRRLRARYRGIAVKEDKNAYRFVHYAVAASAEHGGTTKIEFYTPSLEHDWELDRHEIKDLSVHVEWANSNDAYDFQLLNALPSLKRFTGPISDPKWQEVRGHLPRTRPHKQADEQTK